VNNSSQKLSIILTLLKLKNMEQENLMELILIFMLILCLANIKLAMKIRKTQLHSNAYSMEKLLLTLNY